MIHASIGLVALALVLLAHSASLALQAREDARASREDAREVLELLREAEKVWAIRHQRAIEDRDAVSELVAWRAQAANASELQRLQARGEKWV